MKEHYQLYKAGKLWLTACIAALGAFAASSASADAQPQQSNVTTEVAVAAQTNTSSNDSQFFDHRDPMAIESIFCSSLKALRN